MRKKIIYLFLRVSLGAVFLIFGMGKFDNDVWAKTIQNMAFFRSLPWDAHVSVILVGATEVATGVALILGFSTRFFACIASIMLLGIILLLQLQEIRDIGLLGAAFYLAMENDNSWGISRLLKKKKE